MRIAILGGTFDPIHNGHLASAQSVADVFQVDELHFVPAFSPPHKQSRGITSPFHRFAMVALATVSIDRFRTSTIEVDAFEKRYTVALGTGKKDDASTALRAAISAFDKAVKYGVIPRGTANRKKSRLTLRLAKLKPAS